MSLAGPWNFDPRVFWGDERVKMMNEHEVCAYLRLLSHQWEEGSIPADPEEICVLLTENRRSTSLPDLLGPLPEPTDSAFEATLKQRFEAPVRGSLWLRLQPCFKPLDEDDSRLANPRMSRERAAWVEKKARLSAAGKKGGKSSAANRGKQTIKRKRKPGSSQASKPGSKPPSSSGSPSASAAVAAAVAAAASGSLREEDIPRSSPKGGKDAQIEEAEIRMALLEYLAPGWAEAWQGWKIAIPAQKSKRRQGDPWTPWAEVLRLRTFCGLVTGNSDLVPDSAAAIMFEAPGQSYSGDQILDMARMGADRQWQGFELRWWDDAQAKAPRGRQSRRQPNERRDGPYVDVERFMQD